MVYGLGGSLFEGWFDDCRDLTVSLNLIDQDAGSEVAKDKKQRGTFERQHVD